MTPAVNCGSALQMLWELVTLRIKQSGESRLSILNNLVSHDSPY
jgi:hypothetical protein